MLFPRPTLLLLCLSTIGAGAARTMAEGAPWDQIARFFTPPAEYLEDGGKYRSPLQFMDGQMVTTPDQWRQRRNEILATWHARLGEWPPLIQDHELEILDTGSRDELQQRKLRFRWTPAEKTTGYLLIPPGSGPFPAVITVYYEPETGIGEGKELRDFALQLARRGFVTLSLGTTETTANRTYATYWPSRENARVQPLSLLAYAVANACNLLAELPEVDPERIGITGHSYGGKWSMFASCLYEEFACAAWSDPGIVFDETRPSVNYWEPWYLGYAPPPWRKRGIISPENPATGPYPELVRLGHDLHELHVLMAPRPFFVSGGSEDPPSRWQALHHSLEVNKLLGVQNRVGMSNRPTHSPTNESNEQIYSFFEYVLKP